MISVKFESIQVLRGVAALLVVAAHLQIIEQRYGRGDAILPAWLEYGKASVDLFFVISGFVIATVTRGQFQSLRAAGHFLFQRMTRIYPPYWLYSAAVLLLWIFRPEMVNATQGHRVNIVASFLLLPQDLLPLLMVGWTLVHEMYFYLVITLLMPVLRERAFPVALALWALVVIAGQSYWMVVTAENNGPWMRLAFHPLTLEFMGGAAMALLLNGNIRGNGWVVMSIGIVGFLLAAIWLHASDTTLDTGGWGRLLFFGLPSLLVVHGAASAEMEGKLRFPKMMRKIGDASYSIYLTHVLVLSAIGRAWAQIAVPGAINHAIVLATMVLVTLIVGLLSYRWVEVPILNAIRSWKTSGSSIFD
jgi:peptidoglycan/LPS O-acetylase OafA/YrhL